MFIEELAHFICELMKFEDLRQYMRDSWIKHKYKRINPFKVKTYEGRSGSREFYIRYLEPVGDFWKEKRNHALHLSMYNKINEGVACYFPDLLAILEHLELIQANENLELLPTKGEYHLELTEIFPILQKKSWRNRAGYSQKN